MIDLSYKPKRKAKWQPEEIACAVIAVALWMTITILFVGAL